MFLKLCKDDIDTPFRIHYSAVTSQHLEKARISASISMLCGEKKLLSSRLKSATFVYGYRYSCLNGSLKPCLLNKVTIVSPPRPGNTYPWTFDEFIGPSMNFLQRACLRTNQKAIGALRITMPLCPIGISFLAGQCCSMEAKDWTRSLSMSRTTKTSQQGRSIRFRTTLISLYPTIKVCVIFSDTENNGSSPHSKVHAVWSQTVKAIQTPS